MPDTYHCCCGPPCQGVVRAMMSDVQSMLDSGVTVTVEVKDGDTTVATFGPSSPDSHVLTGHVDLDSATTYTAIMTVEQDGGSTCTFSRTVTTPAHCPGRVNIDLFIPRVWVFYSFCHLYCSSEYAWDMPISVTGPGGFSITGATIAYPDPPPVWPDQPPELRFAFTPCAEGDYTITATPDIPHTTDPSETIDIDYGAQPWPEFVYFNKWSASQYPGTRPISKPDPGYVWPTPCKEPIANTLYLTSSLFGSATLVAPDDGECTDTFEGTGSFSLEKCDGSGSETVSVFWRLKARLEINQMPWPPWTPEWRYSWLLEGHVDGVCRCLFDVYPYGNQFKNRAGDGEAWISGEEVVGKDRPSVVFCDDCSVLDLSIKVTMSPSDTYCDPAHEIWGHLYPHEYLKDTVTITV